MSAPTSSEIPNEFIAALSEAATDLIQFGTLSNYAEIFAAVRSSAGRMANAAESSIDARLETDRVRPLAGVELVRSVADRFPEAFNANIATALSDPSLDPKTRERFDAAAGVTNGNYAEVALATCRRVDAGLRNSSIGDASSNSGSIPPIGGGDESLGCGMILIGSMGGGAACVVGCAPCCPVAAVGGLVFLGMCG
jgi:hypothetical protein